MERVSKVHIRYVEILNYDCVAKQEVHLENGGHQLQIAYGVQLSVRNGDNRGVVNRRKGAG